MAFRNPAVQRADMVMACERIPQYCEDRTLLESMDDTLLFDAVLRNLTVLGEAAGRIDRLWTARHPEVPWTDITGIRHRVVHDYGHVDPEVVWTTVQDDTPRILPVLRHVLAGTRARP